MSGEVLKCDEDSFQRADGSIDWVRWEIRPWYQQAEEIGGIIMFTEVITERKKAQELLEKAKFLAQKYFDIAGVLMVVLNREGRVSLVNQKGSEVLGYSKEEIVGKDWFENFIPEKIRGDIKSAFKRILNGEIGLFGYFEKLVLAKGGKERMIRWNNTVIRDESGEIIYTLSSGEDITENVEAEKERSKVEELLRRSEQEKSIILDSTDELLKSNKRLKELSFTDPHTGLYNYRYLQKVVEAEFQRAKRYAHPLQV